MASAALSALGYASFGFLARCYALGIQKRNIFDSMCCLAAVVLTPRPRWPSCFRRRFWCYWLLAPWRQEISGAAPREEARAAPGTSQGMILRPCVVDLALSSRGDGDHSIYRNTRTSLWVDHRYTGVHNVPTCGCNCHTLITTARRFGVTPWSRLARGLQCPSHRLNIDETRHALHCNSAE